MSLENVIVNAAETGFSELDAVLIVHNSESIQGRTATVDQVLSVWSRLSQLIELPYHSESEFSVEAKQKLKAIEQEANVLIRSTWKLDTSMPVGNYFNSLYRTAETNNKENSVTAYEMTHWESICSSCNTVNILPDDECKTGSEFSVACKNCNFKMNVRGSV